MNPLQYAQKAILINEFSGRELSERTTCYMLSHGCLSVTLSLHNSYHISVHSGHHVATVAVCLRGCHCHCLPANRQCLCLCMAGGVYHYLSSDHCHYLSVLRVYCLCVQLCLLSCICCLACSLKLS